MEPLRLRVFPQNIENEPNLRRIYRYGLIISITICWIERLDRGVEMGGSNSRAHAVQLGQAADENKSDKSHFYHFC